VEASAARARDKSTPAAPTTAIAIPFMKSRRVIPVLIERYSQYGAVSATRDQSVNQALVAAKPGAMLLR
jgi:hypothetical protein